MLGLVFADCKAHVTESPKRPKTLRSGCEGQRDASPVHRTSMLRNEREILPCINPTVNSPIKMRQKPAGKHTDHEDGCSISYRTKDLEDMDLSLKNNSMCHFQSTA